jgi:hypothetical protein
MSGVAVTGAPTGSASRGVWLSGEDGRPSGPDSADGKTGFQSLHLTGLGWPGAGLSPSGILNTGIVSPWRSDPGAAAPVAPVGPTGPAVVPVAFPVVPVAASVTPAASSVVPVASAVTPVAPSVTPAAFFFVPGEARGLPSDARLSAL